MRSEAKRSAEARIEAKPLNPVGLVVIFNVYVAWFFLFSI